MSRDLNPDQPLLEVKDLHVGFAADKKTVVPAVIGANLTVYPGQTVAIVGESGSGKSTTAHAIIDLPNLVVGGGGGRLEGNQHVAYPVNDYVAQANLLITLLGKAGVPMEQLGDSTGELPELGAPEGLSDV